MAERADTVEQTDGADRAGTETSLREHPLLVGGVTAGYLLTVLTSAFASVAVPYWLGYQFEWADEATGLFPAEGIVVERVLRLAFASFPIVFAVCVVVIDLLVVRVLTEQPRSNRLGLLGWTLLSAALFAFALGPTASVLSPYGIIPLIMSPGLGIVTAGLVVVAASAAGVAGGWIPHALFDGVSLRAATKQTAVLLADDPRVLVAPLGSLAVGWTVGVGSFLVGMVVLGLAFGIFIVGLVLLPVALMLWVGAAVGFAAGHVAYRLRTRAVYHNYRQ